MHREDDPILEAVTKAREVDQALNEALRREIEVLTNHISDLETPDTYFDIDVLDEPYESPEAFFESVESNKNCVFGMYVSVGLGYKFYAAVHDFDSNGDVEGVTITEYQIKEDAEKALECLD